MCFIQCSTTNKKTYMVKYSDLAQRGYSHNAASWSLVLCIQGMRCIFKWNWKRKKVLHDDNRCMNMWALLPQDLQSWAGDSSNTIHDEFETVWNQPTTLKKCSWQFWQTYRHNDGRRPRKDIKRYSIRPGRLPGCQSQFSDEIDNQPFFR